MPHARVRAVPYLATVLDLWSKELIGSAIAPHMRVGLAVEAIAVAHRAGLIAGTAIMHTDGGSQYHSKTYRNALRRLEIRQSTSRTGSWLGLRTASTSFLARPGFAANHKPRFELDLAVAAGMLDYLLQPRARSTTPRTKASSSSCRENQRR